MLTFFDVSPGPHFGFSYPGILHEIYGWIIFVGMVFIVLGTACYVLVQF
ncbi:MAG: hypothetical protein ACI92I_000018 [Acidimicrobiales bacterium]|jgi:hypothetical protein